MAFTSLSTLVAAVAADAGPNPASRPQTAYTAVGDLEQGRRAGAPRIVWSPGEGEIEPAEQDESELSKAAYHRRLTCSVTIVGQDYTQAEIELHALLGGLFRTQGHKAARPTRETHRPGGLTGANRYEIELAVEVDIPVYHEIYTLGEIDSAAPTVTLT